VFSNKTSSVSSTLVNLTTFRGLLQADEIAVAYGQRAMPKLVEVLSLPDLSDACSIECLQLLLSLIGSQVTPLSTASKALVIMHT